MLRRAVNPRSDAFVSAFVDAGRWYKAEIAIIMFGAVGGLYMFERLLFDDPAPMVNSWPSVVIGFGLANVLRLASCLRWAVPTWSTALFITSVYIDVVWLMVIRAVAVNGGHDVLPIIVPVAFLASLLIVHIRYMILVPAMLTGFVMIAAVELTAVPSSGPGMFDLMTSGAIIVVPLISARFHERQTRLTWERERRLDELSTTDALTGLANRRAFDSRIADALAQDSPVALAVLDVDEFKVLNDTLGHAAGDDTLRAIGQFLTDSITDERVLAARLSGEEFAVVWSGSDRSAAIDDAERLRRGIGALGLPSGRVGVGVTVSAGVVWLAPSSPDDPDRDVDTVLQAADQALYGAKRAGRDRLVISEAPTNGSVSRRQDPIDHKRSRALWPSAIEKSLGEHDGSFLADFDASGHRARRVIMAGVFVIDLVVLAAAGRALPMPDDSLTVSRWFIAAGLIPLAVIAVVWSTAPSLRPRSGAIQVCCVIAIVALQTTLRVFPMPAVDDLLTVLMPISVILSLGVVQIRFRWMLPTMVGLFSLVTIAEVVAFGINGERILTLLAASSMVAVVIQAAYRLQAVAYRNWQRSHELRIAARVDALTGLPNRRQFTENLELLLRELPDASVAAVMLDVDYLKQYNDAYGHPAGDRCLQRIATAVAAVNPSETATLYRFGGEEFAALITTGTITDAEATAQAMVDAVAAEGIESADPDRPVTVSAGLAVACQDDDLSALMARADAALYNAKRTGRNRLVLDLTGLSETSGRCV